MKSDIFKIHSVKWDGKNTAEEVVVEYIDTGKLTTLVSKNLFRSWARDEGVAVLKKIRQEISGMAVMGKRIDQSRERPLLVWSEIDDILSREIEEATA